MARKLQSPSKMLRENFAEEVPSPKVMCDDEEWEKIVLAMYERKLIRPVDRYPVVDGKKVLNGAFGVSKPGKVTKSGLPVLRLIIDLRATNTIMEQLDGDLQTLTGAASFQKLVVDDEDCLLISGDDLTSAFYLFSLPESWSNYMVLEKKVRKSLFEPGAEGYTRVGLAVLPMGWSSAVAVMQSAHRCIALREESEGGAGMNPFMEIRKDGIFPELEEVPAWTIYLDDTTLIEKVTRAAARSLEGRVPEEQARMRRAYQWWGIPTNGSKALERCRQAERLGAVIDGTNGTLRASTRRGLELVSLGSWIRSQAQVSTKMLQVYAGKAVHILQFRRCLFSCLQELFCEISKPSQYHRLSKAVVNEMLMLEGALPVMSCDLKAKIDPVVTASDACETGGGACYAHRLSRMGETEVLAMMAGDDVPLESQPSDFRDVEEKIVVIDLFAGIGGLERALHRAGVVPVHVVAVEKDPDGRRLLRRRFPGIELVSDITQVTEQMIRQAVRKVAGANGVIAGGGSPCQGISKLSSERRHFEDERSGLFYEQVRVLKLVEKVAREEVMWFLKLAENVVPDDVDLRAMSSALEMKAQFIDAGFLSWARRPRLYWISCPLIGLEDVTAQQKADYDIVTYLGYCEEISHVLKQGCRWKGGERDQTLRFPTFTRAIKRRRPPAQPAGLHQTSQGGVQRWEKDEYRYPPYTYESKYMVTTPKGELRPLLAEEREVLMGYPPGFTQALLKKMEPAKSKDEERSREDIMCSALGNSFHTGVVASLLDHALWSLGVKKLKGHTAILDDWREELENFRQGVLRDPMLESISDGEEISDNVSERSEQVAWVAEEKFNKDVMGAATQEQVDKRERRLSTHLVGAFVKRQEYRGSDIRLDVSSLYRPDAYPRATVSPHRWLWHVAHSYPFTREEHINLLELRALIHTFEWRARRSRYGDCRSLHLADSQVVLSVCVKGRSSSKRLNRLLRKWAALQVAGGIYPILAWIETHLNPADEPSRRHEPQSWEDSWWIYSSWEAGPA